jgi:hypothetical protein
MIASAFLVLVLIKSVNYKLAMVVMRREQWELPLVPNDRVNYKLAMVVMRPLIFISPYLSSMGT